MPERLGETARNNKKRKSQTQQEHSIGHRLMSDKKKQGKNPTWENHSSPPPSRRKAQMPRLLGVATKSSKR